MATGVIKSAGRAIRAMVNGRPVFSGAQMVMERIKICQNCPDEKYIREQDRCAVCGCYLTKSILGAPGKTTLANEKCPKGHW
jgi:ribosomal protein L37E